MNAAAKAPQPGADTLLYEVVNECAKLAARVERLTYGCFATAEEARVFADSIDPQQVWLRIVNTQTGERVSRRKGRTFSPGLGGKAMSWMVTNDRGEVRETFNAELARRAQLMGYRVETAAEYLARINREIAEASEGDAR